MKEHSYASKIMIALVSIALVMTGIFALSASTAHAAHKHQAGNTWYVSTGGNTHTCMAKCKTCGKSYGVKNGTHSYKTVYARATPGRRYVRSICK